MRQLHRPFKLVACEVFKKDILRIQHRFNLTSQYDTLFLPFGYHRNPKKLSKKLQEIIDKCPDYEYTILSYGCCGGGAMGFEVKETPVVIPRVHDCFDIFLGRQKRTALFREEPGTYFLSDGWVTSDGTPFEKLNNNKSNLTVSLEDNNLITLAYSGYKRLVFIRTGAESDITNSRVRLSASMMGWDMVEINSDMSVLHRLLNFQWDSNDFLTLKTGDRFDIQRLIKST